MFGIGAALCLVFAAYMMSGFARGGGGWFGVLIMLGLLIFGFYLVGKVVRGN